MTCNRSVTLLVSTAALLLTVLAVAGCGGSGGSSSAALPTTPDGQPATLGAANSDLGEILVNRQDRTLYLFQNDSGTKSACTGACASNWPPLRANGKPTVGSGANASMVATTTRSDGRSQVTYNDHPLYLFVGDQEPGDTKGEGLTAFGGSWFAVSPDGNEISAPAPNPVGGSGGY